jgi:hypothetical protein
VYLSPRDTFGLFNAPKVSVLNINSGVTQIAAENPDRVVLTIINSGTATVVISPVPPAGTSQGYLLGAGGGAREFINRDHGPLSQCAWYVSISGIGGQIVVIEVVLERFPAPGTG